MLVPPSLARHEGLAAADPPLVCLTGIDGCGKSTHIRRLSEWLANTHGRRAAHLHVWEIAHNPRSHHHPFIANPAAIHRFLGRLNGGPRALFIFHGLVESLHLVRPARPDLILANGSWSKEACERGLFLSLIEDPAVAPGTERIRPTVMATHTPADFEFALGLLIELGRKYGVIGRG